MNLDIYQKTEQFVMDSFTKAGRTNNLKHFQRTVYWVKQLNPDADEALLIAAIAHDIERAFRKPAYYKKIYERIRKSEETLTGGEHLNNHQQEGAKIIADFLKKHDADPKLIDRVMMLISQHETGGDEDQNTLKDADSLSFFENNIDYFIQKVVLEIGKKPVEDKFNWMFNRISSKEAKEIARPWYKEAIRRLDH